MKRISLLGLVLCVVLMGVVVSCDKKEKEEVNPTPTPAPAPTPEPEPDVEPTWEEGKLPGVFSVGATKKVRFSQGNLQYQASTGSWRFAGHQYEARLAENTHIASDYGGWIDLFGWGTGDHPTEVVMDYSPYYSFAEWGENVITNGGTTNSWRSLEKDDWVYLFYTRDDAATLFGFGTVNGMNGLIILPDDWETPEGVTFAASTGKGLVSNGSIYENTAEDNYSHNSYTMTEWWKMERSGAVFLPSAGQRVGSNTVIVDGSVGGYWTSIPYEGDACLAHGLSFSERYLSPGGYNANYFGRSVRLVMEVE